MKAKLIFNLDDPNDRQAFKRYNKSLDMAIVLFEMFSNSKKTIQRYIDSDENITPDDVLELVFNNFAEILEDNNVNINELID